MSLGIWLASIVSYSLGAKTCLAGTYLSITRCFPGTEGSFRADEAHNDIYCDYCKRCTLGFKVLRECTATHDTVCYCPDPYNIYDDDISGQYCSLIQLPFPDYRSGVYRRKPVVALMPKPDMPTYKGEETDDYATQIYKYGMKEMARKQAEREQQGARTG